MPYVKLNSYRELPFSCEAPKTNDYYRYMSISLMMNKSSDRIIRCRAIGVLYSECGRYYLKNLDSHEGDAAEICVSVMYLKEVPKTAVSPYTAQIFGDLQYKDRPLLYARILHVLNPSIAVALNTALIRVNHTHLNIRALDDPEENI